MCVASWSGWDRVNFLAIPMSFRCSDTLNHREITADHPFMIIQENKPPLYLVLYAVSPFPWPWKLLCNLFSKNPKASKNMDCIGRGSAVCGGVCACTENILSRQFFMSFWLWLCSDSIDGVNTVNNSEQRSCLNFVQDLSTAGTLLTIIFCREQISMDRITIE